MIICSDDRSDVRMTISVIWSSFCHLRCLVKIGYFLISFLSFDLIPVILVSFEYSESIGFALDDVGMTDDFRICLTTFPMYVMCNVFYPCQWVSQWLGQPVSVSDFGDSYCISELCELVVLHLVWSAYVLSTSIGTDLKIARGSQIMGKRRPVI